MRVLERASTLVPSCVREATFVVLVCRLLRRVRLGVVGHRGAGARFCMLRSTTRRCRWAPWSWCLVLASRAVVVEGLTSQPRVPRGSVGVRPRVDGPRERFLDELGPVGPFPDAGRREKGDLRV